MLALACTLRLAVYAQSNNAAPAPGGSPILPQTGTTSPGSSDIPNVPGFQQGLTPRSSAGVSRAPFTQGLIPRSQQLRAPLNPIDSKTRAELEAIADQATKSSGAIFQDAENVIVKPPLLTALITLEKKRSPFDLDADSSTQVTLRDVLKTSLEANLPIKIANQEVLEKHWQNVGAFAGFLPNLTNEINFEGLGGNYVTPAGFAIPIHNGFLTMNSGFNWTLFNGGGNIWNYKQTKHQYKASVAAAKGTVNDVLQEVVENYYNLVLNEVLLQICVKQVETTHALLLVNQDLFADGANTQLDVLQSQYEYSMARQQLIQQQVSRRQAAIKLATSINLNPEVDLTPKDRLVSKIQLVDPRLTPGDLLKMVVANRPDLKRYDELRLAAKDNVKVARATFMPVIVGSGTVIGSGARAVNVSSLESGLGLSTAGAGVGPASVATLPISGTSGTGPKSFTTQSLFILGVDAQWNFGGMGLQQTAQLQTARAEARKVSLELNRVLAQVYPGSPR